MAGLGDVVLYIDAVVEGFVSDRPEVTKLADDWNKATRGVGGVWAGVGAIEAVEVVVELAGLCAKCDLGLVFGDGGSGKVGFHALGSEEAHDLGGGFFEDAHPLKILLVPVLPEC